MKHLFLLLLLSGCATRPYVEYSPTVYGPPVLTNTIGSTPKYICPPTVSKEFLKSLDLIRDYANSKEFSNYMKSKRTYFSHTNMKSNEAIDKFMSQLSSGDTIRISFYTPLFPSKALGGWDGYSIKENTKKYLSIIERAGHILHETTHKYGWAHQGNYVNQFDNVNSFPYAVGYDFIDFLTAKFPSQLATK